MLKMYNGSSSDAGNSPAFWDHSWDEDQLVRVLFDPAVCENDPLFPLLQETVRRDRLFLEGGCGQAQWVNYFSVRGQPSVGIDFAEHTVESVKRVAPELDVRLGNILALPFADGQVHTYYSGGVVEHFEGGPEPALDEARRVLAADGYFLCSVPDHSPLRKLLHRGEAPVDADHLVKRVARTESEAAPAGGTFFQYAFTEEEFRARLRTAGFTVERTLGYSVVWGLTELPRVPQLIDLLVKLKQRGRAAPNRAVMVHSEPQPTRPAAAPRSEPPPVGLLRRAFVREDPATPLLGPLVRLMRESCANMRMYVARPA